MSTSQPTPITERQLDLITRAHCDAGGLIEPLLTLKGGAKLKMIGSLAQRGLIEQRDGQWRITRQAMAIVQGESLTEDVREALPEPYPVPVFLTATATPPSNNETLIDAETEAAVASAEASWQAEREVAAQHLLQIGVEGKPRTRENSKQAQVIQMLKRPEGATIAQISEATGWQAHTVRGTFAATFKKKLGLAIISTKIEKAGTQHRVYHIAELGA